MLHITKQAVSEFKSLLQEAGLPNGGIRIFSSSTGCCSGSAFQLEISREPGANDKVFDFDGLKAFVDPSAMEMAQRATLDFFPHQENPGFQVLWQNGETPPGCGCN